MAKPIIAIMYDFDKTLSTTDMQNYKFIPALGMKSEDFWEATGEFARKTGCERILSYMYMMIKKAKEKDIKMDREFLNSCGKDIQYYPGVTTWFDRINKFAEENGVIIEHYLVSSGTLEIVEGCSIFKHFKKAYGCEFLYENGEPVWPKLAINYTQKTQFFFRIAKGVEDITDDNSVNANTGKLRVPYQNMVYIGDGMTDVPCMTLVKKNGGYAIAVYPEEKTPAEKIRSDGRCTYIVKANYSQDRDMEKVLKLIIRNVAIRNELEVKEEKLANK